ncbi:hypothetical protein Kpol_1045p44 [Vanderwaltozyma polyspora DSM 70294]|uniref:MHD domain-containing protein n=1 Tax=Vanderwaltozyma polyspora (strain ATCC 22028 / DSM 70294 / BCRC 21397 / CBS 2163 / NBRC 10782 / NRRL Y-8283 / UCD 57-17) TaxID=436907 RepID=A7TI50_VANPO|nr:uncharacterized protein Kpol_1045p44 [Vanderwaltozyma polyspora DSM 70294]EDO18057.1 hypothetical protein Kpol_1045p44 [Vanderwaltozyma polyspora DSM 70294]
MINGVLVYTGKGELIVSKFSKSNAKRSISDIFRVQVINNLDVRSPILTLGSTTFHHIRSNSRDHLWLVAVTRSNANSGAIWEFLYKFDSLLNAFGLDNETTLKEEFMTCYELLDLMLNVDGVPLDTELSSVSAKMSTKPLHSINSPSDSSLDNSSSPLSISKFLNRNNRSMSVDTMNTEPSNYPWRPNGIKYKKNEIFLNINEKISILVSKDETILKAYVDGTVDLTSHLSGTPTCQFGLNDSLSVDEPNYYNSDDNGFRNQQNIPRATAGTVVLEDCKFHECVSLDKFNRDRIIKFVPPDGHIELMKYHVRDNINLPFKVTPNVINSRSRTGLDYRITLKSLFPSKLSANDVVLKIPVPSSTVDCKLNVSNGKCRFVPEESCIIWKFAKYNGLTENKLSAVTVSSNDTTQLMLQQWARPPISLDFEIMMFSNSGLVVRYLKIMEKDQKYRTVKWIKYISRSGSYEVRY